MSKIYFNGDSRAFLSDASVHSIGFDDIIPSQASNVAVTTAVKTISFGNGYKQEAPDGLNSTSRVYSLSFTNRRKEVIQAIYNFLVGTGAAPYDRDPSEYFYWTPPWPDVQSPLKFKCRDPKVTWQSGTIGTLACTFEQTFEL